MTKNIVYFINSHWGDGSGGGCRSDLGGDKLERVVPLPPGKLTISLTWLKGDF